MGKTRMYVILSVSEISHDQSEKYMHRTFSVGFFTAFRMTCNFAPSFERSGGNAADKG